MGTALEDKSLARKKTKEVYGFLSASRATVIHRSSLVG